MPKREQLNMETSGAGALDLNKSGIWVVKDGPRKRVGVYVKDSVDPYRARSDNTIFWLEDIASTSEDDILMGSVVDGDMIGGGIDITDEFLADKSQVEFLALWAPAWLDIILQDRPEALVSKEVIRIWSQSSEKNVRLLVAKYMSRIEGTTRKERPAAGLGGL